LQEKRRRPHKIAETHSIIEAPIIIIIINKPILERVLSLFQHPEASFPTSTID
jgi:hypothetical protein